MLQLETMSVKETHRDTPKAYPGLMKRLRTASLLILLAVALLIGTTLSPLLSWGIILCTYLFVMLVAAEIVAACSTPSENSEEDITFVGKLVFFLSLILTPTTILFLRYDAAWFRSQHAVHFMLPVILLASSISLFFALFPVIFQNKSSITAIEKRVLERIIAVILVALGGGTFVSLVSGEHVFRLFVWFILVNAMNDSGAYFVGARFSSPSLSPVLSPKKTVLGSIGGLGCGMLTGFMLSFLLTSTLSTPANSPSNLLLCTGTLAVILIAQLGDLMKSIIKRAHGMKDMGTTLPGHGGMSDRLDGILASCPVFAAFYLLLQTGP